MSERTRSFFATIPGVVTGLAGLLTAIVGLVTLLVQLDVIGGDDSEKVGTTGTTVAGSAVGGTTTTEQPTFTVNPSTLTFAPTDAGKEKTVTIRNTSGSARLTVQTPKVGGKDADRFTASPGDCAAPLAAGLSCTVRVTFAPSGSLRSYEALLQIQATNAPRATEVKLTASTLL